jgi:surfeit locus 1 family protein
VLRTALRPRSLGLLALVLALIAGFIWMGMWQLDVAREKGRTQALQAAQARPVVPLSQLISPHQPFPADGSLRKVTVTGRYDPSGQVLVTPRRLDGRTGAWVVTPLVVASSGARVAVVRGFVDRPSDARPPTTTGRVTVTGGLAPGESPSTATGLPKGQMGSIDLSVLLNTWGGDIYNAFVFATAEQPDATLSAGSIVRVPPPTPKAGFDKRNAAYAVQWWVFAAFAAYMWWRVVREEHLRELEEAGTGPDEEDPDRPQTDKPTDTNVSAHA